MLRPPKAIYNWDIRRNHEAGIPIKVAYLDDIVKGEGNQAMEFNAKAIPQGLKDLDQWVPWGWKKRGDKLTKPPCLCSISLVTYTA